MFTYVNEKLERQKVTTTSSSPATATTIIQTSVEQIQQSEMKLLELKLQLSSQRTENDLLKYLVYIYQ